LGEAPGTAPPQWASGPGRRPLTPVKGTCLGRQNRPGAMSPATKQRSPMLPSFRGNLHLNHPHLAKTSPPCTALSFISWALALLTYTYAIAVSVYRSAPPCQCDLTAASRPACLPRVEYREENACDPVRWALWGSERPNATGDEPATGGGRRDDPPPAKPPAAERVASGDRHTHENPHAAKAADRLKFYARTRGDARHPPDRIAYTRFFAGAGSHGAAGSNATSGRREDVTNGTFVEVGAGDGMQDSMTLFFERELNWTGVLVEGATPNAAMLNNSRRGAATARVLNAVCEKSGPVKMIGDGETAGLAAGMSAERRRRGSKVWGAKWAAPYDVQCVRLGGVLKERNISTVDLMTVGVNVEDAAAVLRGVDFAKVRVRVMVVDLPAPKMTDRGEGRVESQVRHMLLSQHFCLAARVGPLEFWTSDPVLRAQHCGWSSFYSHP
jgi:hypothetical protein